MTISLYPDQEDFITEIRNLWRKNKRIMAMACTGFGKTRVAARIIEGFSSKGLKVCFLVPRITLIEQTAKSFRELGIEDITYLWTDFDTDYNAKVTIASMDTYIRREKMEFDLVIVDEAHHARKQILEWMTEHPNERYLGLSATPFGTWEGRYYSALAKSKPMRWLIDNGRLADYDVYAPESPDLSKCKTVNTAMGRDYKESDLQDIMDGAQVVGNIVKNWLENGDNRLTMALCVNVAHANHLCIEFTKAGVASEVITANVPVKEREEIFDRMRGGITKMVLSVNCLTEGFDLPEVSCLINARPTKSRARWSQGAGRALRFVEGKRSVIFDHSGTSLTLGLPEDMTIDELDDGKDKTEAQQRKKEKEQKEKLPKICPKCDYLKPAGKYVCPMCGFKPIVGEDVEVDETRGLTKIKGKTKVYTKEDKQAFWSELRSWRSEVRLNRGKDYSDGYLSHLFKAKFGVWPRGLHDSLKPITKETRNYIKSRQIAYFKSKGKK